MNNELKVGWNTQRKTSPEIDKRFSQDQPVKTSYVVAKIRSVFIVRDIGLRRNYWQHVRRKLLNHSEKVGQNTLRKHEQTVYSVFHFYISKQLWVNVIVM